MTIEDPHLRRTASRVRYVETRAGIKIGAAYIPPANAAGQDAEKLQSALLDPVTAQRLPFLTRLWRAIARWL